MATLLEQILDLGRWAPSGDNTQPWRFTVQEPDKVVVHGHDTREYCVYDLEGDASQLSLGALLCTLDLAASLHGMDMVWRRRPEAPVERPVFDLRFVPGARAPDPLAGQIRRRAVQRRPMRARPLLPPVLSSLEAAAGPDFRVVWLGDLGQRWAMARLLFSNAGLRLRLPEAYAVHRRIIAWGQRESADRLPELALGASWPTRQLMRFGLGSWNRVDFFNRVPGGNWVPRLELDFVPALACAGHLVLLAARVPECIDDFIAAGQAVQRVWLTATAAGLWQQPEMTPLIFARYARRGVRFAASQALQDHAGVLADRLDMLLAGQSARAMWMGRLGEGPAPVARSVRLPLQTLCMPAQKYDTPTS